MSLDKKLKYIHSNINIQLQINIKNSVRTRSMSQNICDCHCGTRIDLDQQLLEQRQMWKQKYLCLQKQFKIDIEILKENIYAECAGIMQQQFSAKEQEHNKIVNQRNTEVKDLIAKIINLETQVKILTKQKQLCQHKIRELQADVNQKDEIINSLKSKSSKTIRDWQLKHEEQIVNTKQRLTSQAKETVDKIEAERDILKQKLKQFQVKYQKILPEIQKMKNALNCKAVQNEELLNNIEKLKKKMDQDQLFAKTKYEDIEKIHSTCTKQIKDLSQKNEDLRREVEKNKKLSRDVKVEPVYIDRPIQVEKVVEKIVQVEKLVNKYVDNPVNEKKMKALDDQNNRLKGELNNILREIKELEEHYKGSVIEYEETIKEHEKNAVLYKKQRENLAAKIGEQNKQLQLLHNFIEKIGSEKVNKNQNDNEKIIVHVKQDGTYQKTVQKIPPQPTTSNQRKKK